MNTSDAIIKRRSIRKFLPKEIPASVLKEIISLSRLYPSGGNLQPVRFAIVTAPGVRDSIFAVLGWAMYLPEFTIGDHERPTGYIVLLRDARVKQRCDYDIGAASTVVMLSAVEHGLATCPIANFNRNNLSALLQLEKELVPELVIAIGYPAQESRVVPMEDSVKYFEDENKTLLVPKHDTDAVIVYSDLL